MDSESSELATMVSFTMEFTTIESTKIDPHNGLYNNGPRTLDSAKIHSVKMVPATIDHTTMDPATIYTAQWTPQIMDLASVDYATMNPGTMFSATMDLTAIDSTAIDMQNGLHKFRPAKWTPQQCISLKYSTQQWIPPQWSPQQWT